mmetsp:Transcript_21831/g.35139  ORF Transcript_21831/g.35139 Transcript_21831/m.35139 type:complete len:125 (+) Transcript_21831:397-771(+)
MLSLALSPLLLVGHTEVTNATDAPHRRTTLVTDRSDGVKSFSNSSTDIASFAGTDVVVVVIEPGIRCRAVLVRDVAAVVVARGCDWKADSVNPLTSPHKANRLHNDDKKRAVERFVVILTLQTC